MQDEETDKNESGETIDEEPVEAPQPEPAALKIETVVQSNCNIDFLRETYLTNKIYF